LKAIDLCDCISTIIATKSTKEMMALINGGLKVKESSKKFKEVKIFSNNY